MVHAASGEWDTRSITSFYAVFLPPRYLLPVLTPLAFVAMAGGGRSLQLLFKFFGANAKTRYTACWLPRPYAVQYTKIRPVLLPHFSTRIGQLLQAFYRFSRARALWGDRSSWQFTHGRIFDLLVVGPATSLATTGGRPPPTQRL